MVSALSKDAILKAEDRPIECFDVPEWGGEVLLRKWSAADTMAFEDVTTQEGEASRTAFAFAIYLSVVGDDGQRLFDESDVPALMQKGAKPLQRVFRKIRDMNRLGGDELDAAEGN